MSKATYIPPTTELKPGQRIWFGSLYSEHDVPGKWVFIRLADGQHTTKTMCEVQQLEPIVYPVERGIVELDRITTTPWKGGKRASSPTTSTKRKKTHV